MAPAFARGVVAVEEGDRLRLHRDAAAALDLERVEQLRTRLAAGHGAGDVHQAVGERALAVVDVRDDAKVADAAGRDRMVYHELLGLLVARCRGKPAGAAARRQRRGSGGASCQSGAASPAARDTMHVWQQPQRRAGSGSSGGKAARSARGQRALARVEARGERRRGE